MRSCSSRKIFSVFLFSAIFLLATGTGPVAAAEKAAVVGFLHDVTGPYATYGVPMRDAMNWAVEEINKKGFEVGGQKYKLEVIVYDSASKPEVEGPGLLKKALYSDKVPLLFLGGSPITRVAMTPVEQTRTPAIIILAGMLDATAKSQYLFRIRPDAAQCAPPLAYFFTRHLGLKKLALIGADTILAAIPLRCGNRSQRGWAENSFPKTGICPASPDFYPILSKVKESGAEAVMLPEQLNKMLSRLQTSL